jgi:hypothetical protein
MSSPAQAIVSQLLDTDTITALVSNRIYPSLARIADLTYPMLVYRISDVSTLQTYSGTDGYTTCKVEIAAIGLNYNDPDALIWAVVSALDSQAGTWGGVTVQGCFLDEDGVSDDDAQETESEAFNEFIKRATFTMIFNQ